MPSPRSLGFWVLGATSWLSVALSCSKVCMTSSFNGASWTRHVWLATSTRKISQRETMSSMFVTE